jgi:hypothetical protein
MKTLRMLVAVGVTATLAIGPMIDIAQAAGGAASADESAATDPAQAKTPVSYPAPLILCRPHQTCPP